MSSDKPAEGDGLGMSDEDFLKMNPPEMEEVSGEDDEDENKADLEAEPGDKLGEGEEDDDQKADGDEDDDKSDADKADDVEESGDPDPADKDKGEAKPEAKADDKGKAKDAKDQGGKKEASPSGSNEGGAPEPTNEQAMEFYKQVMAPFKANGKTIQLKDPSEVIQLMQMGANYTRKLQDIQPHRKMLLMLQNNDLLDEGKLSYLIDLDKKDPEAIKKLIKDAGIDPMDIDTSIEPAYSEGNHRVTDEEATFRQTLDELASTQSGKETVQLINTDWDQASKEALWASPEIMPIIHEQRENGVYNLITTEMDRQKTLGTIPPETPFLQAYKLVGDELAKANAFDGLGSEKADVDEVGNPKKEPVATTKATPKKTLANGDKANAAAPTRTTPRKAEKLVNPLAMSDDEFLKLDNFNGRL